MEYVGDFNDDSMAELADDEYECMLDRAQFGLDGHSNKRKDRIAFSKERIARKNYSCAKCNKAINIGDKYIDYATMYQRTRICLACKE